MFGQDEKMWDGTGQDRTIFREKYGIQAALLQSNCDAPKMFGAVLGAYDFGADIFELLAQDL